MTAASATPRFPEAQGLFPGVRERSAADRNILWAALAGAGLLHLAVFTLPIPEPQASSPPVMDHDSPQITRTELPPPTQERRPPAERRSTRRLLMLDDPDMPPVEPLAELTSQAEPGELAEAPILSPGPAVAPPTPLGEQIHDQWEPGLTLPVAREGRAQPVYPPLGVRVRKEGRVLLNGRPVAVSMTVRVDFSLR